MAGEPCPIVRKHQPSELFRLHRRERERRFCHRVRPVLRVAAARRRLWWRASHRRFAGKSPPAAYAKTATESRLTFLQHRAKLTIGFALLKALLGVLLSAMKPRAGENLALRQQIAVLHRATPRPRLRPIDRAFWAFLSQTWS